MNYKETIMGNLTVIGKNPLVLSREVAFCKTIPDSAKILHAIMGNMVKEDASIEITQTYLAEITGASTRTIERQIKALREHGFIEVEKATGKERYEHKPNTYKVVI